MNYILFSITNLFQLSCPVSTVSQLLYLYSREVVFREMNWVGVFFQPRKAKGPRD